MNILSRGPKPAAELTYDERVQQQIEQYKSVEKMHAGLSPMFSYWQEKHFAWKLRDVMGYKNFIDFYARELIQGAKDSGFGRFISFGSGDAAVEVQLAGYMIKQGFTDFELECLELSEFQKERADRNIAEAGLTGKVRCVLGDFNKWTGEKDSYSGVMAHHALHHVLDLEHLFDSIKLAMHDRGRFVTCDVMGRNGHMKWPEALEVIERLWLTLPEAKRYHHILKRIDHQYVNWDCSKQGFEGIRCQDILPLLVERFDFPVFLGFGCLVDPFTSRGFGWNFDVNDSCDTAFIDLVEHLNETLIDVGHIKPTRMFASMTKYAVENPKHYKHWTAQFSVRDPSV